DFRNKTMPGVPGAQRIWGTPLPGAGDCPFPLQSDTCAARARSSLRQSRRPTEIRSHHQKSLRLCSQFSFEGAVEARLEHGFQERVTGSACAARLLITPPVNSICSAVGATC